MVEISTSILGVEKEKSIKTFYDLEVAGTNYYHIDVMDGKFVENKTMPFREMRHISDYTSKRLDVHLMVNNPEKYIEDYAMLNTSYLTFHYEAVKNVEEMILKVKDSVKGVFILSPYIIEPNREDAMRKRMDEYVAICEKLAKKHNCTFVNFQKMYEDYCKIRHSSYIAWDRIHPNQIGATLMAKEFLKHCDFDYNHGK